MIYLDVDDIKPGETREYELILTKKDGIDICRTITNKVKINAKDDLVETTLEDNEDINDVVIMPRTGARNIILGVSSALFGTLVATGIFLRKKNKIKK